MIDCQQCHLPFPSARFRPRSSYIIVDGSTRERSRSKICVRCESDNFRSSGRCPRCKNIVSGQCSYCAEVRRRKTFYFKSLVLAHYGNECAWCHESLQLRLTIDHIIGDGATVRSIGSLARWRRIVLDSYPQNLRILCFNCNSGRAIYGDQAVLQSIDGQYDLDIITQNASYDIARRIRHKQDVLNHYGTSCALCGQSRFVFLTIDHIGGGGRAHRRKIGNNIYRWLIRENYPDGFRTLCWNCNSTTAIFGEDIVLKSFPQGVKQP